MDISPEAAETALRADLANILKKLNAGKTLSAGERKRMEAARARGVAEESAPEAKFPADSSSIAALLGITTKTVNAYKRELGIAPKETVDPGRLYGLMASRSQRPNMKALAILRGFVSSDIELAPMEPEKARGAREAAKRLGEEEARLHSGYVTAQNAGERRIRHEMWLKTSRELLRYHREVAKDAVELGELVPRSRVVAALREFGVVLRHSLCQSMLGLVEEYEISASRIDGFREDIFGALRRSMEQAWAGMDKDTEALVTEFGSEVVFGLTIPKGTSKEKKSRRISGQKDHGGSNTKSSGDKHSSGTHGNKPSFNGPAKRGVPNRVKSRADSTAKRNRGRSSGST